MATVAGSPDYNNPPEVHFGDTLEFSFPDSDTENYWVLNIPAGEVIDVEWKGHAPAQGASGEYYYLSIYVTNGGSQYNLTNGRPSPGSAFDLTAHVNAAGSQYTNASQVTFYAYPAHSVSSQATGYGIVQDAANPIQLNVAGNISTTVSVTADADIEPGTPYASSTPGDAPTVGNPFQDSGQINVLSPGIGGHSWFRFYVPPNRAYTTNAQFTFPGASSNHFYLTALASTNEDEDGSTLPFDYDQDGSTGNGGQGPYNLTEIVTPDFNRGTRWWYYRLSQDQGVAGDVAQWTWSFQDNGSLGPSAEIDQHTEVSAIAHVTGLNYDSFYSAPLLDSTFTSPVQFNTTSYGANEAGEPAGFSPTTNIGRTAWFRWVCPPELNNTNVTFDTLGSNFDTVINVYQSAKYEGSTFSDLSLLNGNDDSGGAQSSITVPVITNTMFYIQIGGYGGAAGQVNFDFPAGADINGVGAHIVLRHRLFARAYVVANSLIVGSPDSIATNTSLTARASNPNEVIADPDDIATEQDVVLSYPSEVYGVANIVTTQIVGVIFTPDLSDNQSIDCSFDMSAELVLIEPEDMEIDPDDMEDVYFDPEGNLQGLSARLGTSGVPAISRRIAQQRVAVSLPTPVIALGRPLVALYQENGDQSFQIIRGKNHIRVEDPKPDKSKGNQPAGYDQYGIAGRWTVDDLPDPPVNGYYWLGNPTKLDGTGSYGKARSVWAPNEWTPHAPSWHSFFPFKPSVRGHNSYLPEGEVINHPKGVNFNHQYIEHMWLDLGGARPQPFTWCIAAMITGFPHYDHTHYLLDAGRNPNDVGFPHISGDATDYDYKIKDNLNYRQMLAVRQNHMLMTTTNTTGKHHLRAKIPYHVRPKMYFGVFNGSQSLTGAFGAGGERKFHAGSVQQSTVFKHRYYVMGRAQGHISQDYSSNFLVFEIRHWNHALTRDHLEDQYDQLSSSYQFERYRH